MTNAELNAEILRLVDLLSEADNLVAVSDYLTDKGYDTLREAVDALGLSEVQAALGFEL